MSLCASHLLFPAANPQRRRAAQQCAAQERARQKNECLRGTFTCSGGDDASTAIVTTTVVSSSDRLARAIIQYNKFVYRHKNLTKHVTSCRCLSTYYPRNAPHPASACSHATYMLSTPVQLTTSKIGRHDLLLIHTLSLDTPG